MAAGMGHVEAVQALLKVGADLNAADNKGNAAIIIAQMSGHFDVFMKL
jgi:ankyrin repeat protein